MCVLFYRPYSLTFSLPLSQYYLEKEDDVDVLVVRLDKARRLLFLHSQKTGEKAGNTAA